MKERDQIEFACVKSEVEDYMTTCIAINGIDLKRIIAKTERGQLARKGVAIEGGCYEGISLFIAFHHQNHFLGKTLNDYIYPEERFAIYEYKYSGVPGDHSLTCKITFNSNEVIWHDFKNFSQINPIEINYSDLEFRFCLEQYQKAIDKIKYDKVVNIFA